MSSGNTLIDAEIPLEVALLIPRSVAHSNAILPLARRGGVLTLACGRPLDGEVREKLELILGERIATVPFPEGWVLEAVEFYNRGVEAFGCCRLPPMCGAATDAVADEGV